MMRLMVCAAELVCRVAKVRWPVSAMRSADSIVSRSRISPISTTSGSSRSAARSAFEKRVRVGVQLALVDHALLVRVQVLDRVLDRDDVLVALAVDLVDHRRERRRLARAGRPGHQHQAARLVAELRDHRRQAQVLEAADLVGDRAVGGGHRAALHEDVGAEAGQALDAEAEVELQVLLEAVLLRVGEHAVGELLGLHGGQRRQVQRAQLAVDADLRRRVGGDVQVGPPHLGHRLEQLVQADGHCYLLRRPCATRA